MTDRVLLVTPPDDCLIDGIRILVVDLKPEHTQIISDSINKFSFIPNIVMYIWKNGDPVEWLLDKKLKSQIVIFDADNCDPILAGYFAAQKNSYYFGTLKTFHIVNKNAIYSVDDCVDLFDKLILRYEQ